jgi:2-octaprenyl-6-methoxyphenol hydroxylase
LRAPEITFAADEIDLEAFGYNLENRHLMAALDEAARDAGAAVTRIDGAARAMEISDEVVTVALDNGDKICARLVIGADGRRSLCRAAAGLESEVRT